ncbi:hypothetical protein NE237_023806 [Protea cynaroides]|uniref:Uncharacterized protein n=1 Tax=Protea cynaroides TaxID=273540 RepID=A0A9Q0HGZ0_9MAGN|nr:hypothetical protein NE237_023806 [Protea cynaroides]
MLHSNFNALRNLHDYANDLLQLPATGYLLIHHRHEKWVDQVAEGSLRILDICATTRDVLLLVRDHLQDLQSAFRRRSVVSGLENKINTSNFSRKKMKKEMLKCLQSLKQMKSNYVPSPVSNLSVVVDVIQQVQVTTISILDSLLSFMSMSRVKASSNRRSFIFKIMPVKRVASAPEENVMGGMVRLDTAFSVLHGNNFNLCDKTATKQLEMWKKGIEDLEVELEYMFKRLIQTRVSLLNILNS